MAEKINEVEVLDNELVEAKEEILSVPSTDNTEVNKALLQKSLDTLTDNLNQLKTIEDNQNTNVKKVIAIHEKAIEGINQLMQKDVVNDEERKEYVSKVEKMTSDVKEIFMVDNKNKEKDKDFRRQMIKIGTVTLSVAGILSITGKIAVDVIKALKK